MVLEVFSAVLLGAIPVALFTFAILQWSIASGRMKKFVGEEDLQRQHKAHAKTSKKNRGEIRSVGIGDIFHYKIMSFGGGFYGTMAILTYALIEIFEIWEFILGLSDPGTWVNKLGLDLFIEFFVNSVTNLIAAFVWFDTLPEYITVNNGFIWLAAAYGGYLLGLRLTSEFGDVIWEKIRTLRTITKWGG
ncbi:MAG: hypothetical protein O6763_03495 [Gammaproteobacteria bacterium]|nr:hypothetical protein [Gammaproteobacteria bacterium]